MLQNEIDEKTATIKAEEFIMRSIGLSPSIEDLTFDENEKIWTAILKIDYPRFYIDDKTKDKIFKYITLKPVGQIRISSEGEILKFTPKDKIVENMYNMFFTFRSNVENALVKLTASNLSQLKEALHVLEPMKTILDNIYYDGKFMLSIFNESTEKERGKHTKYFPLLESLGIIESIKGGYGLTNYGKKLKEDTNEDFDKFKMKIVEIVLSEKYGTLRQVFNITRFEPFIHVSNSEYQSSVIAEKLLTLSEDNLQSIHAELFGYVDNFKFKKTVRELFRIEVFKKTDNGLITGYQSIFNNLMEQKNQFPMSLT